MGARSVGLSRSLHTRRGPGFIFGTQHGTAGAHRALIRRKDHDMRDWGYGRTDAIAEPALLLGFAFLLLLAAGVAAALIWYGNSSQGRYPSRQLLEQRPAVQVLDRRYARGELTEEDYLRRRAVLTGR